MDWVSIIASGIGIGGLAVAVFNASTVVLERRAQRFFDRSKQLVELNLMVAELGPLSGASASKRADRAHTELVARVDLEIRANALLYLNSAGRLTRPGSLPWGIFSAAYGVVVAALAINEILDMGPSDVSSPGNNWISVLILGVIAAVLLTFGLNQIYKRAETRLLRRAIGQLDDLTIEGVQSQLNVFRSLARSITLNRQLRNRAEFNERAAND